MPENNSENYREARFDGFILKPIQREKLYRLLGRLLGDRRNGAHSAQKTHVFSVEKAADELENHEKAVSILIAEDNKVNQKLAEMMLKKGGFYVDIASNGQEAVDKVRGHPNAFDLVLMDIQMPVMDGFQATDAIRKAGFRNLPIVAMTAHAMKGYREKCMAAGMNGYLTKPIRKEAVLSVIKTQIKSAG